MYNINNKDGSLLMNILVFCGIAILLTTLAMPYLRKYQPNLKLSADARNIASDLRLAQQLTITEQVPHLVYFDFSNDRYSILRLPNPLSTSTLKMVELDAEVAYQQINNLTGDLVRFNSYGAVSESGYVTLINTNGKTSTIYVRPSGYVQISE